MDKRISRFRKKQMMNEIFARHAEGVLAERQLKAIKQTLFEIAYFEFEQDRQEGVGQCVRYHAAG